jgi:peroxiredoxin
MQQTFKLPRAVLACGLVLGLACWPATAQARDSAGRPEVGDQAADFQLESLDAKTVKLSKLLEEGPVVLIVLRGYPGYQCPVCNAQVAQFLSRADKFREMKARVVLIYPGPAGALKNRAAEFVRGKTLPDNFHLLLDPDYNFTNAYGLRWSAPKETAYPSTFVIDGERRIRFARISMSHGGRASAEEVLRVLPAR